MEKNFEHIQSILNKTLQKNNKIGRAVKKMEAKQIIQQELGDPLLQYIQDIIVKGNTIIIKSNESVLRQEIKAQEHLLLQYINTRIQEQQFEVIEVRN